MPYYETVFMARQDLTETQVKDLEKEACKIIEDNGGKTHKTEYWGLLTLAYKINKAKKAHYILIESDAPGPAIHELERNLRINEDVLRTLTVRQDKLSDEPSIMMKKSGDYGSDDKPKYKKYDKKDAA
ncbi:30S ribosomal protein S6 [Alphaproteobacteria bacterium]|nr:30S ribosomal protein S6 [Alphaproteobacteria bacterium]